MNLEHLPECPWKTKQEMKLAYPQYDRSSSRDSLDSDYQSLLEIPPFPLAVQRG